MLNESQQKPKPRRQHSTRKKKTGWKQNMSKSKSKKGRRNKDKEMHKYVAVDMYATSFTFVQRHLINSTMHYSVNRANYGLHSRSNAPDVKKKSSHRTKGTRAAKGMLSSEGRAVCWKNRKRNTVWKSSFNHSFWPQVFFCYYIPGTW